MEYLINILSKTHYHVFMVAWFVINILIALGNWTGKIRFGLGMGDLIYMGIIGVAVILVGIYYIKDSFFSSKAGDLTYTNIIIMMISLCFLIFIILQMTYFRGAESKWDGRIFF